MSNLGRFFMGFLTAAFILAAANSIPALAQDKAAARVGANTKQQWSPTKVLYDNDKVRVQEVTFRPGDQGPNTARPFRIIRVLKGGTMQRIYPDGKIDKVVYKTGEVKVFEADKPFTPKNVGKSDIVLYVVALKEPKK